LNLVDVAEVARGHLVAAEKAKPGERYILGGENLTLKQILDKLASLTGLPAPTVKLPYAVALLSGAVDTFSPGCCCRGRVTLDAVRMDASRFTACKAERELG
jgi:dihydroflavonol-4-reductase